MHSFLEARVGGAGARQSECLAATVAGHRAGVALMARGASALCCVPWAGVTVLLTTVRERNGILMQVSKY